MSSRCIALIAPPRTGTSAFRQALGATPDFHTFGELFGLRGEFTSYIKSHPRDAIRLVSGNVTSTMKICGNFFAWLARQSRKPFFIADCKQNTLNRLGGVYAHVSDPPLILRWLMANDVYIVTFERDPLDQAISHAYAAASGTWNTSEPTSRVVTLDPRVVHEEAARISTNYQIMSRWLARYERKAVLQYSELFRDGRLSQAVTGRLSSLIGHPVEAAQLPTVKLLRNPEKMIANYDELLQSSQVSQ